MNVEGNFGRFKPDVVAPGVFVISDRSPSWDTNAYYNPTNTDSIRDRPNRRHQFADALLFPGAVYRRVGLVITLITNNLSPAPFAAAADLRER